MGDLAARPRGGWQVGSAFRRQGGEADAPGDVDDYSVAHTAEGFVVRHYTTPGGPPCCVQRITITDADRAQAFDFERRKGTVAALQRAHYCLRRKPQVTHARESNPSPEGLSRAAPSPHATPGPSPAPDNLAAAAAAGEPAA